MKRTSISMMLLRRAARASGEWVSPLKISPKVCWFDTSKKIVADGQLSWTCRRYLPGDPPPWEGADLRYGCLVWDLVDKSSFGTGTAFRGNVWSGFFKELLNIHGDGITETSIRTSGRARAHSPKMAVNASAMDAREARWE